MYDPVVHHRRSIRLQGYDYSHAGAYFVTICAQGRLCLFGNVADGEMRLNEAGRMVGEWYCELGNKFPDIQCDAYVCMPNHAHFIVVNGNPIGADLRVRPLDGAPPGEYAGPPAPPGEPILGEHVGSPLRAVVQWFKTMTTNAYIRGVKNDGWQTFPGKLWQRNYWEHIIRNEQELNRIREYICNNPAQWERDRLRGMRRTPPRGIRDQSVEYAAEVWMI